MGTIGDQLGADLLAFFGGEGEAPPEGASVTSADGQPVNDDRDDHATPTEEGASVGADANFEGASTASGSTGTGESGETATASNRGDDDLNGVNSVGDVDQASLPTAQSVVLGTIAELTGLSESTIELDDSLVTLDITGLPLWAVVAELERFTGEKFPDSQVEAWETPRDLVRAATDR